MRGLQALGYEADGWDPVHRPHGVKRNADIVNLGYVLNVIEDPAERVEALIEAHRHANRLLVVSALITETVEIDRATKYCDGVRTQRNIFQKYTRALEEGLELLYAAGDTGEIELACEDLKLGWDRSRLGD